MTKTSAALSSEVIFLHKACAGSSHNDYLANVKSALKKPINKKCLMDWRKCGYLTKGFPRPALQQFGTTPKVYPWKKCRGATEKIVLRSFAAPPIMSTHNQPVFVK